MTSTETPPRTSAVSGPAVWAATSNSRAASAAAARASEESPGWAGWISRGDLGADRPGLGVGLVEEHAGDLRGRGQAGGIDGGGHRF